MASSPLALSREEPPLEQTGTEAAVLQGPGPVVNSEWRWNVGTWERNASAPAASGPLLFCGESGRKPVHRSERASSVHF